MKLHLPKNLLTAVLAVTALAHSAMAETVTINALEHASSWTMKDDSAASGFTLSGGGSQHMALTNIALNATENQDLTFNITLSLQASTWDQGYDFLSALTLGGSYSAFAVGKFDYKSDPGFGYAYGGDGSTQAFSKGNTYGSLTTSTITDNYTQLEENTPLSTTETPADISISGKLSADGDGTYTLTLTYSGTDYTVDMGKNANINRIVFYNDGSTAATIKTLTLTGDIITMVWAGTAENNIWSSDSNTPWNGNSSSTTETNVVFGAIQEGINNTVVINGNVEALSVAIKDNYHFQADEDAHITAKSGVTIETGKILTISSGNLQVNATMTGEVSIADNAALSLLGQKGVRALKVTGGTGAVLNLDMTTNVQDDARVILSEGSNISRINVTGIVAYNENWQNATSNFGGADLHFNNNGVLLIRNGATGQQNANIGDIFFDGDFGEIRAYGTLYKEHNVTIANDITAAGTLRKTDGGYISLSGEVSAEGTIISQSGTLGLSGTTTAAAIMTGGGNIVIDGTATASQLRLKEQGGGTVTVSTGGILNITGTENGFDTSASLLMAHWGTYYGTNNTGLIIDGGELNATGAVLKTGWSSSGHFKVLNGTANIKGISFWGQSDQMFGEVVLGSANGDGTARLNIGELGITNYAGDATLDLSNGILGATADWTLSHNTDFTASVINLTGTTTGTVIDTTDAVDKKTGRHITFKNALTGAGKLTVDGVGSLTLCVAGDNTGDVTINQDATLILNTSGNYTLKSEVKGSGALKVESGTNLLNDSKGIAASIVLNGGNATLKGDRSISGNITIMKGSTLTADGGDVLQYNADESLPASSRTITIDEGGVLAMGENRWSFGRGSESEGGDDSIYGINLAGGKITGNGNDNGNLDFFDNTKITATKTTGEISADIKVRSNKTLSVEVTGATDSVAISGKIISDGNITKDGQGNMTLSGENTYTGKTTINAGTLTAANETALGDGQVTLNGGLLNLASALSIENLDYTGGSVNNGGNGLTVKQTLKVGENATLAITGSGLTSVGTLQLATGAKITTEGNLTMANLDMATGSKITANEAIALNGSLTLRGQITMEGSLISSLENLTSPEQWVTLFTGVNSLTLGNDTYNANTRNILGVVDLSTYLNGVDANLYRLSYNEGNVYAGLMIPEPTTATLSLLALAGLAARRRRK